MTEAPRERTKIKWNFEIPARNMTMKGEHMVEGNQEFAQGMVKSLNQIWGEGSHWVVNETGNELDSLNE